MQILCGGVDFPPLSALYQTNQMVCDKADTEKLPITPSPSHFLSPSLSSALCRSANCRDLPPQRYCLGKVQSEGITESPKSIKILVMARLETVSRCYHKAYLLADLSCLLINHSHISSLFFSDPYGPFDNGL
ncbi:unnamed protein product [Hydatigera taeniaeformis]|uniref:Ovule protein n=1 Tax=Hydatigena taeniaeformis TaxID=6205 RepID=A0A0R3X518_HYDTA|nr:unnamed protein product [Hydatigera taeniaeformis]